MIPQMTIGRLAATRKVVYYPGFAYLLPTYALPSIQSTTALRDMAYRHLTDLRWLSLYFDHVMIPAVHLLASPSKAHLQIVHRVLRHEDFHALVDDRVVITTSWAGDQAAIRESRCAFLDKVGWPIPPVLPTDAVRVFDRIQMVSRDVVTQSTGVRDAILRTIDHSFSVAPSNRCRQLIDMVLRSECAGLPFAHERFLLLLLSAALSDDVKAQALTATNTDYFEAGTKGNPNTYVYQIPGAESADTPRSIPHADLDAILAHPYVFEQFLRVFFTNKEVRQLKRIRITSLLKIRDLAWERFRDHYHNKILPDLQVVSRSTEIIAAVARGLSLAELIRENLLACDAFDVRKVPEVVLIGLVRAVAGLGWYFGGLPLSVPSDAKAALGTASPVMARKLINASIGLRHPNVRHFCRKLRRVITTDK